MMSMTRAVYAPAFAAFALLAFAFLLLDPTPAGDLAAEGLDDPAAGRVAAALTGAFTLFAAKLGFDAPSRMDRVAVVSAAVLGAAVFAVRYA